MASPCLFVEVAEPLPTVRLCLPLVLHGHPAPTPTATPDPHLEQRRRPLLVSPQDGSHLTTLAPELFWLCEEPRWYGVQIATDIHFQALALSLAPCAYYGGPQYKATLLVNLEPGTLYYWRVGAEDGRGAMTWSETWSFVTPDPGRPLPDAPTQVLPPDGSTVSSLRPRLAWQNQPGADAHQVTLGVQRNGFTYSLLTPVSELTLPFSLLPGRTYAWHVRTRNDYGWGPPSETWLFVAPHE